MCATYRGSVDSVSQSRGSSRGRCTSPLSAFIGKLTGMLEMIHVAAYCLGSCDETRLIERVAASERRGVGGHGGGGRRSSQDKHVTLRLRAWLDS
jgi:hypothetical protein